MDTDTVVIHDSALQQWLTFRRPHHVISAHRVEQVIPALKRLEELVEGHNLYAAGWLAYEAAAAFDSALAVRECGSFPLLWFGLYSEPERGPLLEADEPCPTDALAWEASVTRDAYYSAIARIKDCIEKGDTYQVNYTYRLNTPFTIDPWSYFLRLAEAQNALYSAFVNTERWALCSASPELFFRLDGTTLVSRPMKGTAARGVQLSDDLEQCQWLEHSEKNRAENVMIVDMVRNDMSRVAETGTVHVPRLFEVEKYPTVWQMTSTVVATTQASLTSILKALFPPASITGAPKPRTMEIIADLETEPRRIYTGSIGFVAPDRVAQFNVAIRTVLVDKALKQAEYGVGGGIVWDSTADSEFEECHTKARILTQRPPNFSLLESILWTPGAGWFLLDYHMARLKDSADYFSFSVDVDAVREVLAMLADTLEPVPYKVRVIVDKFGRVTCQSESLPHDHALSVPRVCLARSPVNSSDRFLYHKTTHRSVYDAALAACPGFDDVILWNEKGEVTESCFANVVVRLDGELYTPPIRSGLLAGTFRAWLLERGEIQERVILKDDLTRSDKIYLINSVRRMREAILFVQGGR